MAGDTPARLACKRPHAPPRTLVSCIVRGFIGWLARKTGFDRPYNRGEVRYHFVLFPLGWAVCPFPAENRGTRALTTLEPSVFLFLYSNGVRFISITLASLRAEE